MAGIARLDEDLARKVRASGAPGDLLQLGEAALACAVIAREEPGVGVEHPHEGETREVMPLGENLGPYQDIRLLGALEHVVEAAPRAHHVAIQAQYSRPGEFLRERQLDSLRAASESLEIGIPALRA